MNDHREIIDFEIKGNSVKFYLGKNGDQWGDDWNDAPYEHNAGLVYPEYVSGFEILNFDWDDLVLQPCDGQRNSPYTKEDMIKRQVPCVLVVPASKLEKEWPDTDFDYWLKKRGVKKFYFGQRLEFINY